MIPLARRWYNFVADYHRERVLDHSRRRDVALRKLERIERRELMRQVQAELACGGISVNQARRRIAPRPLLLDDVH